MDIQAPVAARITQIAVEVGNAVSAGEDPELCQAELERRVEEITTLLVDA